MREVRGGFNYTSQRPFIGLIDVVKEGVSVNIRMKCLDAKSKETQEKLSKGTAKIVRLTVNGLTKEVAVEAVEFRRRLTSRVHQFNNRLTRALHSASGLKSVAVLDETKDALHEDWNERISELSSIRAADKLLRALQIYDTLEEGVETHHFITQTRQIGKIIRKGVNSLIQDNSLSTPREILNISREIAQIKVNRLFFRKTIPDWLLEVEKTISILVLPSIKSIRAESNAVESAAIKGKTKRATIDDMMNHMVKEKKPFTIGKSIHCVHIGQNSVFKRFESIRASQEERVADCFGQIFDPELYVPQIGVRSLSVDSLGISPISTENEQRSLDLNALFSENPQQECFRSFLYEVLAEKTVWYVFGTSNVDSIINDRKRVEASIKGSAAFEKYKNETFNFNSGVTFSFKEFAEYVRRGLIHPDFIINERTIEKHFIADTDLAKAIRYANSGKLRMGKIFLNFDLVGEELMEKYKGAYDRCSKEKWVIDYYEDRRETACSFAEAVFAMRFGLNVLRVGESNLSDQESADFNLLLNLSWTYVPFQVGWAAPATAHGQVAAKPRVYHMSNQWSLRYHKLEDVIFRRIDDPMQFAKAVRTLYVQPADLHENNIGVHPLPNDDYLYFNECMFTIDKRKTFYFIDLLRQYLKGEIKEETKIFYIEDKNKTFRLDDNLKELTIATCPRMKNALETKWNLDFFDTDLVLYSNNKFLIYGKHVLPAVRNGLLGTSFASVPLSQEVIGALKDDSKKVDQALHYLKRYDHPLYHRMTQAQRDDFRSILDRELESYTLNERLFKPSGNLGEIRYGFAEKISADVEHELWALIDQVVPQKTQIKEPGNIKGRFKTALEIFPRATLLQQRAFLERMERQKKYFEMWEEFNGLSGSTDEKIEHLSVMIQGDHVPLSATQREKLEKKLVRIKTQKNKIKALEIVISELKKTLHPTIDNLIKVHFPMMKEIVELRSSEIPMPNDKHPMHEFMQLVKKKSSRKASYKVLKKSFDEFCKDNLVS